MSSALHYRKETDKIITVTRLGDFLTQKYLTWQAEIGEKRTIEEFAMFIGISRPLLNMWMNGKRKPSEQKIKILSALFGDDVYDALGKERPDPDLTYLQAHWINTPPEARKAMREIAEKYSVEKKEDDDKKTK